MLNNGLLNENAYLNQLFTQSMAAICQDSRIFAQQPNPSDQAVLLGLHGFLIAFLLQKPDTVRGIWLNFIDQYQQNFSLSEQVAYLKNCQKYYTVFRTIATHAQLKNMDLIKIHQLLADHTIDLINGNRGLNAQKAMLKHIYDFDQIIQIPPPALPLIEVEDNTD